MYKISKPIFIVFAVLFLLFFIRNNSTAQDTIYYKDSFTEELPTLVEEVITYKDKAEDIDYEQYAVPDTIPSQATPILPHDLKKKYDSKEYNYKQQPVSDWNERFKQWLNEFIAKLFRISDKAAIGNVVDIIVWLVYIVLILGAIYFIYKALRNKDGRWIFRSKDDAIDRAATVLESEDIKEDLHTLIDQARRKGIYRDAIRYHYVWLLKNLHQQNQINYSKEKTAADYAYEIKNSSIKSSFKEVARIYNAVWYGFYEIDEAAYNLSEQLFQKVIRQSE